METYFGTQTEKYQILRSTDVDDGFDRIEIFDAENVVLSLDAAEAAQLHAALGNVLTFTET